MFRSVLLLPMAFLAFACFAGNAQTVKKTPVPYTSPASGKEMFQAYCAVCHGVDGRGNGPAASALKKAPANLAELTQRNDGKFPELKVIATINGDATVAAHGSRDMPIWGPLFASTISHGSQSDVQMRVSNLTAYIKSLQAK